MTLRTFLFLLVTFGILVTPLSSLAANTNASMDLEEAKAPLLKLPVTNLEKQLKEAKKELKQYEKEAKFYVKKARNLEIEIDNHKQQSNEQEKKYQNQSLTQQEYREKNKYLAKKNYLASILGGMEKTFYRIRDQKDLALHNVLKTEKRIKDLEGQIQIQKAKLEYEKAKSDFELADIKTILKKDLYKKMDKAHTRYIAAHTLHKPETIKFDMFPMPESRRTGESPVTASATNGQTRKPVIERSLTSAVEAKASSSGSARE